MLLLLKSAFDIEHTCAKTAAWEGTSILHKQCETGPDAYKDVRARETIQHLPKWD